MSDADRVRGHAVVVQPNDGPSYWQPVPANGHADPKLYPGNTRFDPLSMGFRPSRPEGGCASTPMAARSSSRSAFAARATSWSMASAMIWSRERRASSATT